MNSMKKILSLLCACLMITGSLSSCGQSDSSSKASSSSSVSTKKKSVNKSSSSAVETSGNVKTNESKTSDDKSQVKEVETRTPVDFNVDGYYSFSYEGFDKVYSNEEVQECFENINDLISNANYKIAVSYKNMDTGAQIYCGTDIEFVTASTIKAPYIKSILQDGIDLDEMVTKTDNWTNDDQVVASATPGTQFSAKELIEHAILESDNTAYYSLVKHFGCNTFNNFLYSIGASFNISPQWIFCYCRLMDVAQCYWDIYDFAEENEDGKWLIDLMTKCNYNEQIGYALGDKYTVAQKYGSDFDEINFNDCAIVYADSPFVLCIFTGLYPEIDDNCEIFRELAVEFDKLNSLIAVE